MMEPLEPPAGADLREGLFVDRLEGEIAVLLTADGQQLDVQAATLPPGAREGVWLRLDLSIDPAKGASVLQTIAERRTRLLDSDDGSDIVL